MLAACGPERQFSNAKNLEKKGRYYEAWQKYQQFAASFPKHPVAPEALFRAGWLAQRQLNDCYMASTFYDNVLERYPQADPWARLAVNQKNNCPDYFPLIPGFEWVEGDSDSKGKHARIQTVCKPFEKGGKSLPSEAGLMVRTYFAGDQKIRTNEFLYKKSEQELHEFSSLEDPRSKVILKWPVVVGAQWKTKKDGRLYEYEIASVDKKVEVVAGIFENCVQVKSSIEGYGGSTFDYYAPGVGRILTTLAAKEGETRNTELISYKKADWPDIDFLAKMN